MSAVTITEIALLVTSIVCFVVSFMIPEKKPEGSGIDQELAREEVKEMVKQEVDNIRGHVDDVVKESMDYAMEKTERSLERLSNEKIMAVNEYSDSVMQEIHKNHEEVVFLYDMLNNKHDTLKKTVAEASKAAKVMQSSVESIQSFRPVEVSYGEGSVKIAPLASKLKEEPAADSLKTWKPEVKPYTAPSSGLESRPIFSQEFSADRQETEPVFEETDPEMFPQETASDAEPFNGDWDGENAGERTEIHLGGEDGSRNKNEQILELHDQGKSNVAIAKELGLGVGEVKLVIDLYKNA